MVSLGCLARTTYLPEQQGLRLALRHLSHSPVPYAKVSHDTLLVDCAVDDAEQSPQGRIRG